MEMRKRRAGIPTLEPRAQLPVLLAPPPVSARTDSGRLPRLCLPLPALPTLGRGSVAFLRPRSWWTSSKRPLVAAVSSEAQHSSNEELVVPLPEAASTEQASAGVKPSSVAVAGATAAVLQGSSGVASLHEPHMIRSLPSPFQTRSQSGFSEDGIASLKD